MNGLGEKFEIEKGMRVGKWVVMELGMGWEEDWGRAGL